MKKGFIAFESLVSLIPHLLITIGLFAILFLLYSSFTSKELSPDEQDFNRIVEELKSMIDRKQDTDCIRVPVRSSSEDTALLIQVHPKGSPAGPPGCSGDACLCHTPVKDGKTGKLNCVRFAKLDCSTSNNCLSASSQFVLRPEDTVVTIIKDSTGIELEPNVPCEVQS